ncbi:MAG: hypothetical protein P8X39_08500, partial [Desulfofustis sp.]
LHIPEPHDRTDSWSHLKFDRSARERHIDDFRLINAAIFQFDDGLIVAWRYALIPAIFKLI